MNSNFCILPWISVDRNTENPQRSAHFTPCCLYESHTAHTDPDQYWQSPELAQLRKSFTLGERPAGCHKCWRQEDAGLQSLRQAVLASRQHLLPTGTDVPPRQAKYWVGHECNLACRMCTPDLSSGVERVWQAIGRQHLPMRHHADITEWIKANAQTIQYIDVLGGEPFFHKRTRALFQYYIDQGLAKGTTLYITTNGTRVDPEILNQLKHFREVVISVSIDAVGTLQEYIRPGLVWSRVEKNINQFRSAGLSVQIMPVISVLNILNWSDLESWCQANNLYLANPGVVETPIEMAPHNLPVPLHSLVPAQFQSLITQRTIDADSVNYIRQLDRYWKTDITAVLPAWCQVLENLHWQNFDELVNMNQRLDPYVE